MEDMRCCTSFDQVVTFDCSKVPALKSLDMMSERQRLYCYTNGLGARDYPLIGLACFVPKDHIEAFNALRRIEI